MDRDVAQFQDEMSQLALAGRGRLHLLEYLSTATVRPARLIGLHGDVLVSVPSGATGGVEPWLLARLWDQDDVQTVVCSDGWRGGAVALRAGPRRAGLLMLQEPLDATGKSMLLAARVPMCIEAVRRDVAAIARAESGSSLIDEIRYGSLRPHDELIRAGERFGLALDRSHTAAVFSYDGDNVQTWTTALNWIEMPVRQTDNRGWTVLFGDIKAELTRIRSLLQGMVGGDAPVLAATGSVVEDIADTTRSFLEAEIALELMCRRRNAVEQHFDALGLDALLFSVPKERLRHFMNQTLGPIADRADLLETLAAWLETNGSLSGAAHRLRIHRNSVGYRMGRIRKLLDFDTLDPKMVLRVQAAMAAREVLLLLDERSAQRVGKVTPTLAQHGAAGPAVAGL